MNMIPIWRRPVYILLSCIFMVMIAYGTRQSFGLFMRPISIQMDWGREAFAFALATQNLLIGIGAAIAGILTSRWGAIKTITLGGSLYALGLILMSLSETPKAIFFSSGILAGLGLSGCGVPILAGVVGQIAPKNVRTTWIGLITGAATGGQILILPVTQFLLNEFDWTITALVMSIFAIAIVPIALSMHFAHAAIENKNNPQIQPIFVVLKEAIRHKGYMFLTFGFFICGFQIQFIGSHLPAYLVDSGTRPDWGAMALMLVALFNMIGSWCCGWLGDRYKKKYVLSILYTLRSVLIIGFILLPISPLTIVIFSAGVGLTWLGTLPLVSGILADVFGIRHLAMLFGIVYCGHQLGAFTGVWLGGFIFDYLGSYASIWQTAIILGFVNAIIHIKINDKPIQRIRNNNQLN